MTTETVPARQLRAGDTVLIRELEYTVDRIEHHGSTRAVTLDDGTRTKRVEWSVSKRVERIIEEGG